MIRNFTFLLSILSISVFSQKYESVNDSLYQNAVIKRDAEKYDESLNLLSKISRLSPEAAKATIGKAETYYAQKKYDEAEKELLSLDKANMENGDLSDYYNTLGNIYDDANKREKAIEVYNEALKKFPNSYILYFNKGVSELNQKKNVEAYKDLVKSIEIYPEFAKSHYILGLLALENGNLSEGTLAVTTSILLDSKARLSTAGIRFLNMKLSEKFAEPENKFEIEGSENFSNIENILRKQYALNKDYKLNSEMDIPYIRQLQALLSELPKIKERKGFFSEKYVDFYTKLWNSNQFKNLTYYLFRDFDNENLQKMVAKKNGEMKDFISWAIPEMSQTIVLTNPNFSTEKLSSLAEDGYIGYGKIVDKKKDGKWIYNYFYGEKAMEVNYKQGIVDGETLTYYYNGKLSGKSFHKDGKLNGKGEYYFNNGNLKLKEEFVDDKVENKLEQYYYLGGLKCTDNFLNDKKNGKEECFYANGNKKSFTNFSKGIYEGAAETYFPDGKLQNKYFYVQNYYDGDKTDFYPNQNIQTQEKYKKGNPNGNFIQNSANGENNMTYSFENENSPTLKKYFGKNKIEERQYSGNKLLKQIEFVQGKPFVEYIFAGSEGNERVTSYKVYDENGNALPEIKVEKEKPFQVKTAKGQTYFEGQYDKKGLKTGAWKYYNAFTGILESVSNYQNDKINGKIDEYFPNGKLKTSANYINDKKEGALTTYYSNGSKNFEQNYINDVEEGEARVYYKNGKLKAAYPVEAGKVNGIYEIYDILGNLSQKAIYRDGEVIKDEYFYDGKKVSEVDYAKNGKITFTQANNSQVIEGTILNGKFEGSYIEKTNKNDKIFEGNLIDNQKYGTSINYTPNGKISSKIMNNNNNEVEGDYEGYNIEGKILSKSVYHNGLEYGPYQRFFHEGFKYMESEYFEDKQHGKQKFYGNNGEEILTLNFDNGNLVSYQRTGEQKPIMVEKGNAKITANYKNGKPAYEINYANGELNGDYKFYSENGTLLLSALQKDGLLDGKRQFFYLDGKPYLTEEFLDGDYNGKLTSYYPDGKVHIEANYSQDKLHGDFTEYDAKGTKIVQKKYYNDTLIDIK